MDNKKAECFGVALVETRGTAVAELIKLLRGISSSYKVILQHEVVMKAPYLQGTRNVSIRLTKSIGSDGKPAPRAPGSPPERWSVSLEQQPMRGPGAERLPAVVREHVTPTSCWSDQAPAFWTAMGASVEYEVVREGQVYTCIHEGYEMKVQVVRFWQTPDCRVDLSDFPKSMVEVLQQRWLVEVATLVPFDAHDKGAKAVASFAQRLLPIVELRKA